VGGRLENNPLKGAIFMKHEHRIPAKATSFLLALVMLIGCISVGFTAFAAEDSYLALANAMRSQGMRGVIPVYKVSSSPGVKNTLSTADPKASSAVYVQSTAMWEAMDAFWKAAGGLRSKDVGNITVGDNGNVYDGWTGENNTARKIASAVAAKLVDGGYMTADELRLYGVVDTFNWFIGGYTAEHALLDAPARGDKPALAPWTLQVFGSTGYFGAVRTRDEALFAGTRNYKQIPATLELNRRWAWAHDARYARNSAGNARQYWHVLGAMSTQGNVAGAKGLAFDPAQADTAALKALLGAWDSLFTKAFFERDLSVLGTQQLEAIRAAVDDKVQAAKELKVTNSLLYFYGLPTHLDVGAFQRKLNSHLELSPYRPFVNYFNNANAKNLKKLSKAALNEEVLAARQALAILQGVQFGNLDVYRGLVEENGLNMSAAEEYFGEVLFAISETTGKQALINLLASSIDGNLTYNTTKEVYELNSSTHTLAYLYALYERIALINETLTGYVGSQPNFPASAGATVPFDLAAALATAPTTPTISVADAVDKALAALRLAIAMRDPAYFYDYISDPPSGINTSALVTNYPEDMGWTQPPEPFPYEHYPAAFHALKPGTSAAFYNGVLTNPGATSPASGAPDRTAIANDAVYYPLADTFIASAAFIALLDAIGEQGLTITAPVPTVGSLNLALPVDQTIYANQQVAYINEVLSNYATVKGNYDNWKPTYDWVKLYADVLAPGATQPSEASPPQVPPTQPAVVLEPEYEDYWDDILGVYDDFAYDADVLIYEQYLDDLYDFVLAVIDFIEEQGDYHPVTGTLPGLDQDARAYFELMTGRKVENNGPVYPVGSSLESDVADAVAYIMLLGSATYTDEAMVTHVVPFINWDQNTRFPNTAGSFGTTMENQYDYLVKLDQQFSDFQNFQTFLNRMLTVPQYAYNNITTMQRRYEWTLVPANGATESQINDARWAYVSAVNNYNTLLATAYNATDDPPKRVWTSNGTTPLGFGANEGTLIFPGYAGAKAAHTTVTNQVVALDLYGLFFNPYRLSLADLTVSGITTPGMLDNIDTFGDWDHSIIRYSDADLRAELAAVQKLLKEYNEDDLYGIGLAPIPIAWLMYLGGSDNQNDWNPRTRGADPTIGFGTGEDAKSLYGAIRNRVETYLNAAINTSLDMSLYMDAIGDDTSGSFSIDATGKPVEAKPFGTPGFTGPYSLNTIGLYTLISGNDYGKDMDEDAIPYAQRLLAMFRGYITNYETLHWDLMGSASMMAFPNKQVQKLDEDNNPIPIMDGDVQKIGPDGKPMWEMVSVPGTGTNWYPVREVAGDGKSIVLLVGQDEFVVRYEHIENFINKLDTLLTSQFVKDLMGPNGFDLSFGAGGSAVSPAPAEPGSISDTGVMPNGNFHIPELQGDIIAKLGEMRFSSDELVIRDPNSGVTIVLPPLDTQLNTMRWVDEEAGVYAQRRWIQAYRGDVLLYLLHFIFEAINTGTVEGSEMLSWLLKTIMGSEASSVNGMPRRCICRPCRRPLRRPSAPRWSIR